MLYKRRIVLPDLKSAGHWVYERKEKDGIPVVIDIYDLDTHKVDYYKQYDLDLPFKKVGEDNLFHILTSANAVAFHVGPEGYVENARLL